VPSTDGTDQVALAPFPLSHPVSPRPVCKSVLQRSRLTCGFLQVPHPPLRLLCRNPSRVTVWHPASFRAVRDPGLVPAGCPRGSGAS
jgi:hypothetical protein